MEATIYQKQWRAKKKKKKAMTSLEYFKDVNYEFHIWKNNPSKKGVNRNIFRLIKAERICFQCNYTAINTKVFKLKRNSTNRKSVQQNRARNCKYIGQFFNSIFFF